jgi:hypothetical protein
MHNLSYAQNVGYALPGFNPTVASSESAWHDSILKGWQYLSANGVNSLNVSAADHATALPSMMSSAAAFPGLNHKASAFALSTSAASSAAAAAAAAAVRAQSYSRRSGGSSDAASGARDSNLANFSDFSQQPQFLADSVLIQQQHRQLSENRSVASASESGNRVAQASSNLQFSVAPGNRATMPASVPSHSALAHISNDPRVAAPQGSVRRHSSDSTTRVRVLLCSHDSPSHRLFLSYFAFDE